MGRVPTKTNLRGAGNVRISARANPNQFGAQAARATAAFAAAQGAGRRGEVAAQRQGLEVDARAQQQRAQVIQRGTEKIADALADRMERDQEIEARKLDAEFQTAMGRRLEELKTEVGEGGEGYSEKALAEFDKAVEKINGKTRSTFQRELLGASFDARRAQVQRSAADFEVRAQRQKRVADLESIIEHNEARLVTEPEAVKDILKDTQEAINRANLSASTKRKLRENAERGYTRTTIQSMILSKDFAEADKLLNQTAIIKAVGADQALKLKRQVQAGVKKQAQEIDSAQILTNALKGDVPVDPSDNKTKKAIDKAVKVSKLPEALRDLEPAAAGSISVIVKKTGIFPPSALSALRGLAENGDQNERQFAYQTVSNILRISPHSISTRGAGKKIRQEAEQFNILVGELGISPDDAVKRIDLQRSAEFEAGFDTREKQGKKLAKDVDESVILSEYDGFNPFSSPELGGSPRRAASIMATYRDNFISHYAHTGDEATSRAQALKDMRNTFDVTTVTGSPRVMRRPPEKHYPAIDGGHDYFSEQLQAEVSARAGQDVPLESIFIEAVPDTEIDIRAERSPGYGVVYMVEKDGIPTFESPQGLVFRADVKSAMAEASNRRGVRFKELKEIDAAIDRLGGDELSFPESPGATPEDIQRVLAEELKAKRDALDTGVLF